MASKIPKRSTRTFSQRNPQLAAHSDQPERKSSKLHDSSLPVLQYGGKNHAARYLEWKRTMTTHCQQLYGPLAKILITMESCVPDEIEIPDPPLDDATDPGGYC